MPALKSQDLATIRALPDSELKVQLRETEERIFKLKFANAVAPLKNGLEINGLKKHRARLLTWLRANQIAAQKGNTAPVAAAPAKPKPAKAAAPAAAKPAKAKAEAKGKK